MMHTAVELLKFKRLVRRLRSMVGQTGDYVAVETICVGLLERLWHATAREARDGRIGAKFDESDIAELVGWVGEANQLIEALVAERWLDRDAEGVLCVHDWDDHKPNWLRGVERRRSAVCVEEIEPGAVPGFQPSELPSSELGSSPSSNLSSELPNLTKPNPTVPNATKPNQNFLAAAAGAAAAGFDWDRFADAPSHRESVRVAAAKLDKATERVLCGQLGGREAFRRWVWELSWVGESVAPGFVSGLCTNLRGGGVKNYLNYCRGAIRKELEAAGITWAEAVARVPELRSSGELIVSD